MSVSIKDIDILQSPDFSPFFLKNFCAVYIQIACSDRLGCLAWISFFFLNTVVFCIFSFVRDILLAIHVLSIDS